ncbi:HPr family phosphocarrier protein [Butyrivibrio sp. MC2013]|uniref:HPr family phosphocarrier protein n=1 Tax=Butyrivibrio sp. MC2013 TaxID=1280686 RepID=UPI00041AA5F8|nr:HPr family phosphocarrier protein [Butyrivibrio sp. MC2013]
MLKEKIVIKNPTGLHLKPAGVLCKVAMDHKCQISFAVRNTTGNAKSVLSVLGACIRCGDEVTFTCDGEDEQDAMNELLEAARSGFGEL